MKKRVFLLAVSTMLILMALGSSQALAKAPLVVDGINYTTIQAAVNAANPGDTILVNPGVYNEAVAIGTNDLTLVAKPGAILDGTGLADVGDVNGFTIANGVSGVTIKYFEIRNYTSTRTGVGNGIQAWNRGTSNISIKENVIHDNSWNGFLVGNEGEGHHTNWSIKENTVYSNKFVDIELTNGKDSEIKGNTVTAGSSGLSGSPMPFDGILVQARNFDYGYLGDPPGETVTSEGILVTSDNKVTGPYLVAGIDLLAVAGGTVGPRKAVLKDVKVAENEVDGARIIARGFAGTFGGTLATASDVEFIKVAENNVHDSPVPGIHLSRVTDSDITENQTNDNERGIVLTDSDNNRIMQNTANNNTTYGIRLINDSDDNTISGNTATGNGTFDLFQDGTCTGNTWNDNTFSTSSGI